jgi:glycosyltransferase involved in cell wall biosynthesis
LNSIILRWFLAKKDILNQIGKIDVDLYYALSDWWSQEFCYNCSQAFRKPYAVRLRGDYIKDMNTKKRNALIRWISKRRKLRSYRNADRIIPVSKKIRESAMEWISDPTKLSPIVPSGVDVTSFRQVPMEKPEYTVAYIGRISPEKGIETLVETMRLAKDTRFIMVGEIQMEMEFPDNCEYLGRIPHSQMPHIYNQADLVILTSETEGMPLVILEAYSCNVPVLTHKEVFPSELAVHGIVQTYNEPKDYVDSINRMKKGDFIKMDARGYVERNFSWKSFGEKMHEQFTKILR